MAAENEHNSPEIPKSLRVCTRCQENLQTSCNESILLSCLHTYCKVCVRTGCLPRIGDGSSVECPQCKGRSHKQDIGCSLFFVGASEAYSKDDKCVACDEGVNATSHCVQCDEMLCDACVQAHRRVRITKDHTIKTTLGEPRQQAKPIYCPRHSSEKLRLFCEPCEKLTCRFCQLEFHKDHKYCFMNEAADVFRQFLTTKLKLVEEKHESVQHAIALINKRIELLNQSEAQTRAKIRGFIELCHVGLNSLWRSLSGDLMSVTHVKKQSLLRKRDEVENLFMNIDRCKKSVEYATKCGSDAAILCTRKPFMTHISDMLGAKCQVPNPSHTLDIRFQYDPKFFEELACQGTILINGVAVERGAGGGNLAAVSSVSGVPASVTTGSGSTTVAAVQDSNVAGASSVVATSLPPFTVAQYGLASQQLPLNHQSDQPTPSAGDKLTGAAKLQDMPSTSVSLQPATGRSHAARTSGSTTVPASSATTSSTTNTINSSSGAARTNQRPASVADQQSRPPAATSAAEASKHHSRASCTSAREAGYSTVDKVKAEDDESSGRQDDRSSAKASGSLAQPAQGASRACSSDAANEIHAEEPDVCAAESSHSPKQPAQPLQESSGAAPDVEMVERGQGPDQIEADSAVGQDSIAQGYGNLSSLILLTDIKSLAPEAGAPTTDSRQDSNLDTSVPGPSRERERAIPTRSRRWSPYNVSNNHREDDMNEDYCAVCHNGGELMCCDTCPKVYHMQCHVPELSLPHSSDRWSCSLCMSENGIEPHAANSNALHPAAVGASASTEEPATGKRKAPLGLTDIEIKMCEHILLQLFCHKSSVPFHFPVQKTVPNYYKLIKEPIDFTSIKKKLQRQHFNHYMNLSEFIADVNLVFANCLTYNPVGWPMDATVFTPDQAESELAAVAKAVHDCFVDLVRQLMPHLIDDAIKVRKPEDVMNKNALKKKKSLGTESPLLHIH